ncbi:unnamed protein product [Heterosigma akashiwo]
MTDNKPISSTGRPSLDQALSDVETRFILNLPEAELSSSDRLFFQIEQAHWFYEDFYAETFSYLPHFRLLSAFALELFNHCPLLHPYKGMYNSLFEDFHSYKGKVPVAGVIILNPPKTKFLLVQGWKGKTFSFPRGKVNSNELAIDCAAREAYEECGFECRQHLEEEKSITLYANGQRITLYLAFDVSEDTVFEPVARKEISKCAWFDMDNLPKTFSVLPFIPRIKRMIGKSSTQRSNVQRSATAPRKRDSSTKKAHSRPSSAPKAQAKNWDSSNDDTFGSNDIPSQSVLPVQAPPTPPQPRSSSATKPRQNSSRRNSPAKDRETFGARNSGWSVEDMFAANARLTGNSYNYDGNPHEFGNVQVLQVPFTPPPAPPVSHASLFAQLATGPSIVNSSDVLPQFQFDSGEIMACF